MTSVVITRRNKFRFGWTNSVRQTKGGLVVCTPSLDDKVLSASDLVEIMEDARKINSGNDWQFRIAIAWHRGWITVTRDEAMCILKVIWGEEDCTIVRIQ